MCTRRVVLAENRPNLGRRRPLPTAQPPLLSLPSNTPEPTDPEEGDDCGNGEGGAVLDDDYSFILEEEQREHGDIAVLKQVPQAPPRRAPTIINPLDFDIAIDCCIYNPQEVPPEL